MSKEETHDRSMARLLIILVVLAVFVLVQSASQKVIENSYNRLTISLFPIFTMTLLKKKLQLFGGK